MFSYEELSTPELIGRFARGRFTRGGPNAVSLAAYADRSPGVLVALVNGHQRPRGSTAGFGGRIALTDGTIHLQDIRRPMGRPRQIPPERLVAALEFARPPRRSARRDASAGFGSRRPTWTGPPVSARK